MLKNPDIFLEFCKGLQLPLNGVICSNTDVILHQIYEKYFEERVNARPFDKPRVNYLLQYQATNSNQKEHIKPTTDDVWIFGYGSLVWKADFPYIDRRRGYISGYKRRFFQNSIDHRGTAERPGRVVTLLATKHNSDRVYGIAYRIAASRKKDVLEHLDYREKNGYDRCSLKFHQYPSRLNITFPIIMYVATHGNESYAGHEWQLPVIADQIFCSAGVSGSNREYLFNLANAMRDLFPGVRDDHLFTLEELVMHRIMYDEAIFLERSIKAAIVEIVAAANDDGNVQETVREFDALLAFCEKPGWKEEFLWAEMQQMKNAVKFECPGDTGDGSDSNDKPVKSLPKKTTKEERSNT